ncbi:heme oxygenase (decycling) 1 [Podila minutissima]|uniref:heme oxygenase (biliverdin-producing) n=1 Tax=Podila minutissima TaxID=64525 RepID=A0A9P5SEV7_9FUNG|nr:heme oxygenase (decycling) 1 [Podila minutissima]
MALLAADLKEGTKTVHADAERSKFIKYFFKGEISPATYGRFLISLYQVYTALEKALDAHKDNENLALLYFPVELSRKAALEEDLEFFNGPEWRDMLNPVSPAQKAYIAAIERCSNTKPELLIAHSYVRYLGDLSGGQMLSKKLQKYNDLPEGKGVAFYEFPLIEDLDDFKNQYRKRLNQVEVDEETHQQIVEESCQAFVRNIDIFQEFDHELEGLPLTKKEKEALEAAQAEQAAHSGFLANLAPSNLINSIASAVGLKSSA